MCYEMALSSVEIHCIFLYSAVKRGVSFLAIGLMLVRCTVSADWLSLAYRSSAPNATYVLTGVFGALFEFTNHLSVRAWNPV